MNRKNIEEKIWGKSISYGRQHGIISKQEAEFLLNEYMKEFQTKVSSRSEKRGEPSSVPPTEAKRVKNSRRSETRKGNSETSRSISEHTGRT